MKHKKLSPRRGTGRTVLSILVMMVVALLLIFSVQLVRTKMLQNAQNLGDALAQSYAVEEELNLKSLTNIAILASQYVNELTSSGSSTEDIQQWLSGYFGKLSDTIGDGLVDPYAVIGGEIVAANPWEGDEDYRYQDTLWYQQALEANGQAVCGDVYSDVITGNLIFTISISLERDGDVFAMDVFLQNKNTQNTASILPEGSSYYLCDHDGTLLTSISAYETDPQTLQQFADYLMERIRDGTLSSYDATFTGVAGDTRGAYYQELSNGWTVILTIPINTILMGDQNTVFLLLTGISIFLFITLSFLFIRDWLQNRRMKRADDTAHMLGDSFYAIFRVNFRDGVYEGIKISDDMQKVLPPSGDYTLIMNSICALVKSSTYQEFQQSFSLESIRQRVELGVADFGGDFQRRFDGVYRWVNIRTLYDPEVAPDEVILCFRDVDAEKRQELQHTIILQEALEAAKKGTRAKSDFFSRMSHDMRTPLNAIIGCCQLAKKSCAQGDLDQVGSSLKKIEFAGDQLLGLINDILELSRAEAGRSTVEAKPFDLRTLLNNTVEIFQVRATDENKELVTSLDLEQTMVLGDQQKLSQILNNLLSNAIKYTNPGDTIRLEVKQFAFQKFNKYQIIVEDTGVGMSETFLEHLFEPYSRETSFSPHSTVGTGLGMPIVKSLVQQLSGEISVESTLGVGSKFTVTIPLPSSEETAEHPSTPRQAPFDWTGRQILVAEDNDLNREILTELLEELGVRVLAATEGMDAVRVFAATKPYSVDVILMDMQMPEMDGCQAATAIRGLDREDAGWVPIIAVTANAFAEDIDKTTKAGMNAHVSKPIDFTLLAQTIQKCVAERDAH